MALYERFLDGVPWYLARHYWWAYLWKHSIWFFDHQPIINAILFGNYRKLQAMTLPYITTDPAHRVLQLTCVYGELTGKLLKRLPQGMTIVDACTAQLELAKRKTADSTHPLHCIRLNAESLSFADNSFDQIIVFFLFHEMPHDARLRCINEIARTLRPGGSLILTEYTPLPEKH
ncbi:MAG: methyltransferase domain-containing protein, partial [Mariprofundaceae bacterium]|nr:methyltransferase domain-containing protein [Mariprofundaceae bacterium]